MNYVVPPIGSKGSFKFKEPFNKKLYENQEYIVRAIRLLKEIQDSNEDPYKNIYEIAGLTEKDFKEDLENNVPILVLSTSGSEYTYVPANRVTSLPITTGLKYQETMLAINLGYIPLHMSLDQIKEYVSEAVVTATGISSTVEPLRTSAVTLVDETEHKKYMLLLENKKKLNGTYLTKFQRLEELYNTLKFKYNELENWVKINVCPTLDTGTDDYKTPILEITPKNSKMEVGETTTLTLNTNADNIDMLTSNEDIIKVDRKKYRIMALLAGKAEVTVVALVKGDKKEVRWYIDVVNQLPVTKLVVKNQIKYMNAGKSVKLEIDTDADAELKILTSDSLTVEAENNSRELFAIAKGFATIFVRSKALNKSQSEVKWTLEVLGENEKIPENVETVPPAAGELDDQVDNNSLKRTVDSGKSIDITLKKAPKGVTYRAEVPKNKGTVKVKDNVITYTAHKVTVTDDLLDLEIWSVENKVDSDTALIITITVKAEVVEKPSPEKGEEKPPVTNPDKGEGETTKPNPESQLTTSRLNATGNAGLDINRVCEHVKPILTDNTGWTEGEYKADEPRTVVKTVSGLKTGGNIAGGMVHRPRGTPDRHITVNELKNGVTTMDRPWGSNTTHPFLLEKKEKEATGFMYDGKNNIVTRKVPAVILYDGTEVTHLQNWNRENESYVALFNLNYVKVKQEQTKKFTSIIYADYTCPVCRSLSESGGG